MFVSVEQWPVRMMMVNWMWGFNLKPVMVTCNGTLFDKHHLAASHTSLQRLNPMVIRAHIAPVAGPAEASPNKYTAGVHREQTRSWPIPGVAESPQVVPYIPVHHEPR